jgi:hypothetical protein
MELLLLAARVNACHAGSRAALHTAPGPQAGMLQDAHAVILNAALRRRVMSAFV